MPFFAQKFPPQGRLEECAPQLRHGTGAVPRCPVEVLGADAGGGFEGSFNRNWQAVLGIEPGMGGAPISSRCGALRRSDPTRGYRDPSLWIASSLTLRGVGKRALELVAHWPHLSATARRVPAEAAFAPADLYEANGPPRRSSILDNIFWTFQSFRSYSSRVLI